MTIELQILFCAIVLGLIQLLLAVLANVLGRGMPWSVGPRDAARPDVSKIGGRLERAYANFLETFPFFAAAVLVVHAVGAETPMTALGARLYIWARLLYVPAYVIGIPYLRSLIYAASIAGIVLETLALWPR